MDCILINSPDELNSQHIESDPKMPLGLLYLAAYVRNKGYSTKIIDFHSEKYDEELLTKNIKILKPSVIGFNISTPNRKIVYKIIKSVRNIFKNLIIFVGGVHASCMYSDIIDNCPEVNCIIVGEGEKPLLELLENKSDISKCKSLILCHQGKRWSDKEIYDLVKKNCFRDIDNLPFPNYYMVDYQKYFSKSSEAYISCSRGCKYNCAFCSSKMVFSNSMRFRHYKVVIEEMNLIHNNFNISKFYFYDDNIVIWKWLDKFCKTIYNLGYEWTIQATINDISNYIIDILHKGNCSQISFGFESGSDKIQNYIGKIVNHADALDKVKYIKSKNIKSRGYFIIGFPQEDIIDIAKTALFIVELKKHGLDDICIFPARPYPGTRLFKDCVEKFGKDKIDDILAYKYLKDSESVENNYIKGKLDKYNTITQININDYFSSIQIRSLIIKLYELFYNAHKYYNYNISDIRDYLLNDINKISVSG